MSTHNIGFYEDLTKIIKYHQIRTLFLLLLLFFSDGVIAGELYKDKLQAFRSVDPELKKKFDQQHRQYEKKESAYSIQNVLWLIAAIGVLYYTDFYLAIRYDPRINR